MIELGNFLVLFASFILVIVDRHSRYEHIPVSRLSAIEIWFFIYSIGYSVDKLASIAEHGWSVYAAGLTNGLDAASVPIYIAAFVLRAHSVVTNDARASDRAYAILSTAACLLFPRLAFATISNNLLILSLRAMLGEFLYLFGYVLPSAVSSSKLMTDATAFPASRSSGKLERCFDDPAEKIF